MKNNKNIIDLEDGDRYSGSVKIMRKTQPGPIIFTVSDGYGNVDAVVKDSNFKVDDTVDIAGSVNERAGRLQIEIEKIKSSKTDFSPIIEKNSTPINTKFSIESKRFEKLRPYFYKIAKRVRKAILENQPISIRHHADSDGINAGMAIEQSCKMFMEKIGVNPEFSLYRSPSRTPFYDINDVLRDVVLIKRIIEGHGQKKPLIIVLDNGSGREDVFGLKALKSLGFETIVIDHHNPVVIKNKKTLVDPYVSFHLNPYIEGLDSQTCAGMLAYETARWICEDYSNTALPAVAGLSDRSVCEELDKYVRNSGRTKKELEDIGTAIDFVAYNLKFNAGKGLFETLYENHELVEIIDEEVRKGVATQLETTLPYLRTQNINSVFLATIDLEKYTMRFSYPNPGKIVGMIHDSVAVGKDNMPVMTLGYLSDSVIIRATQPILPVQTIIDRIKKDIPYSHIGGGGHEKAGTIRFTPAHLDAVLEKIKEQVRELDLISPDQESR
ncbi:MAG: DHH family phosphoesterase [Candidatus Nealsonbacteria bacterium]